MRITPEALGSSSRNTISAVFFPLKEYSWDIFFEPCRHPEWSFLKPITDFLSFARPGYTVAFFAKLSKPDRLNDLAECREVATPVSEPRGDGRLHKRMPSDSQFHLGGIVGDHLYT